jgi:hypothetical protein
MGPGDRVTDRDEGTAQGAGDARWRLPVPGQAALRSQRMTPTGTRLWHTAAPSLRQRRPCLAVARSS